MEPYVGRYIKKALPIKSEELLISSVKKIKAVF
jgi:hypothetical protein